MKKVLLFVGLLVILVMLSMNVREGLSDDQKIERDKDKFNELWNASKANTRNGGPKSKGSTPLEKLDFVNGSGKGDELKSLIASYKHSKSEKNIEPGSTFDQAMAALNYRMRHN